MILQAPICNHRHLKAFVILSSWWSGTSCLTENYSAPLPEVPMVLLLIKQPSRVSGTFEYLLLWQKAKKGKCGKKQDIVKPQLTAHESLDINLSCNIIPSNVQYYSSIWSVQYQDTVSNTTSYHISLSHQENYKDIPANSKKEWVLQASYLVCLVATRAPSSTNPDQATKHWSEGLNFIPGGSTWDEWGTESSNSLTCYLLSSTFCKLQLQHIALFAPKYMLISSSFTIKS